MQGLRQVAARVVFSKLRSSNCFMVSRGCKVLCDRDGANKAVRLSFSPCIPSTSPNTSPLQDVPALYSVPYNGNARKLQQQQVSVAACDLCCPTSATRAKRMSNLHDFGAGKLFPIYETFVHSSAAVPGFPTRPHLQGRPCSDGLPGECCAWLRPGIMRKELTLMPCLFTIVSMVIDMSL